MGENTKNLPPNDSGLDKAFAYIKKIGIEKILLYAVVLYFFVNHAFGWLDSALRSHYENQFNETHLEELLMLDQELQHTEEQLSEKANTQRTQVLIAQNKYAAKKTGLSEVDKKIQLYENKGIAITENTNSVAIGRIDSLRAKLKAEREERAKRLQRRN